MRNSQALIWQLGQLLAEHNYPNTPQCQDHQPPDWILWIEKNIEQIQTAINESEVKKIQEINGAVSFVPVSFDREPPEIKRIAFPRLTIYLHYRLKLLHSGNENPDNVEWAQFRLSDWAPIEDLTTLTVERWNTIFKDMKTLGGFLHDCKELTISARRHILDLYRLDIISIAARVVVVSDTVVDKWHKDAITHQQKMLQALVDTLQALLDSGQIHRIYPWVLDALAKVSQKAKLLPQSFTLKQGEVADYSEALRIPYNGTTKSRLSGKHDITIKVVHSNDKTDQSLYGNVIRRKQFCHPNVVSLYGVDVRSAGSQNYLAQVFPYYPMGSIDKLDKCDNYEILMILILDIARGLQYLHEFNPSSPHGALNKQAVFLQKQTTLRACIANLGLEPDCTPQIENQDHDYLRGDIESFGDICSHLISKFEPGAGASHENKLKRDLRKKITDATTQETYPYEYGTMAKIVSDLAEFAQKSGVQSPIALTNNLLPELRITAFDLLKRAPKVTKPQRSDFPQLLHGENESIAIEEIKDGDTVVILLGISGSGKSSFINDLLGCQVADVGHTLESCTPKIRAFGCMHPNRKTEKKRVVIVDTPGFNDTNRLDSDVLEEIATWLKTTYSRKILISGVLEFHSIQDTKLRGTSRRTLGLVKSLCGEEARQSLIFLTTFWGRCPGETATPKERELQTFGAIENTTLERYDPPTYERAWEIIDCFKNGAKVLEIQDEMVNRNLSLYDTKVFQDLLQWWKDFLKAFRKDDESKASALKQTNGLRSLKTTHSVRSGSSASSTHTKTSSLKKIWFK